MSGAGDGTRLACPCGWVVDSTDFAQAVADFRAHCAGCDFTWAAVSPGSIGLTPAAPDTKGAGK